MRNLSEDQALNKLASLCSRSEYCEEDIRIKLKKWLIPENAQEQIIKKLIDDKFIDNERFCHSYINDKLHFSHWGKIKIKQGLGIKKISSDIINKNIELIDDSDYEKILRQIIENKKKTIKGNTDYERNAKLIKFAMGRGFEFNHIRNFLSNDYEEMD